MAYKSNPMAPLISNEATLQEQISGLPDGVVGALDSGADKSGTVYFSGLLHYAGDPYTAGTFANLPPGVMVWDTTNKYLSIKTGAVGVNTFYKAQFTVSS